MEPCIIRLSESTIINVSNIAFVKAKDDGATVYFAAASDKSGRMKLALDGNEGPRLLDFLDMLSKKQTR